MDRIEQNFQGILGCFGVTFVWVVLLPSHHQEGLGLHPGFFPEVKQLCGPWCYRVISYHFGQHLTSQTTMVEWILWLTFGTLW